MYIQYGSTFVQGHELAGVTEDGRAVAIEAIFGCGDCEYCDAGEFNLCATTSTTALGMMVDGGMSEWFRAPARSLVPCPTGSRSRTRAWWSRRPSRGMRAGSPAWDPRLGWRWSAAARSG